MQGDKGGGGVLLGFFNKEVRSEPRPVSLPAELRAQPSPGAGGQLALLLQGSS